MKYSQLVIDHFNNPRNVGELPADDPDVGTGFVGSPACGDAMQLQIRVNDGVIQDVKFKTFGCAAAIASSSLASEWLKGKSLLAALKLNREQLAGELELPPVKVHCSVMAIEALHAAMSNYNDKKQGKTGETPSSAESSPFVG
jgi:nitrogen fixation NifU-like protein